MNSCQSEKKYPEVGVFFTFFIKFFVENQEHNLLPECNVGPFTYVYLKIVCQTSVPSILNLSKSGNILFIDQCQMEIFCSTHHQLSLVLGDNSLVHELRVMVAADVHINPTYILH